MAISTPQKVRLFTAQSLFFAGQGRRCFFVHISTKKTTLKAGKVPGYDEIRSKMLKTLNREGFLWLTRVFQVAWCSVWGPKVWQSGVIIPSHK